MVYRHQARRLHRGGRRGGGAAAIRALGGERVRSGRYRVGSVATGCGPADNLVLPASTHPASTRRPRPSSADSASESPLRHFRSTTTAPCRVSRGRRASRAKGSRRAGRSGQRRSPDGAPDELVRGAAPSPRPAGPIKAGCRSGRGGPGLVARNGFRFAAAAAGARVSARDAPRHCLRGEPRRRVARGTCQRVGNGLYVGRIWYTYPINGLEAGDSPAPWSAIPT